MIGVEKTANARDLSLSHGQLMDLLDRIHGAEGESEKSKIRSRFKSLQKAELPEGDRPGRGTRARYSIRQVCQTILLFEFAQIGIDAPAAKDVFGGALKDSTSVLVEEFLWRLDHPDFQQASPTEASMMIFTINKISTVGEFGIVLVNSRRHLSEFDLADFIMTRRSSCSINFEIIAADMVRRYPKD